MKKLFPDPFYGDSSCNFAKMLIHVAENGQSFELDCRASTSVEEVQSFLVALTGVAHHDQLLIVGDTRLEPQRSLGSYRLPSEDKPIFLFNRQRLTPDSPLPYPEGPECNMEAVLPPVPSSSRGGHRLDDAPDPALRALPSYERQFKYHREKGHAIRAASQRKFEACRMLLDRQKVQEMALETAKGNMQHYYRIIDQLYQDFMRHFAYQHRQHSDILANFERDLERLKACKLHPALRTESRKTLIDCVKEASLRKWAEDCAVSHKRFSGKVSQLKDDYIELQHNVENLFASPQTVNIRQLEETIGNYVHYTEEQTSIMQSLSKDVNTVKKLIDDCLNTQFSASLRPHDAVSALGPMYDVHDKNHLPRMETCDYELAKLLAICKQNKNTMNTCVHVRMQNVAALQCNIRDMRNQLTAFKEAMARQDEIFEELKFIRKIGPAYKACLAEVIRRKAYMKLYMGQAGQLAEKLAREREKEIARRERFLQSQSMYIPRDVMEVMGLYDSPSQCVVNIAPFDTHLLDIDIESLENYAPESLVGPLYKFGGSEQGQGSRSSSLNDGSLEIKRFHVDGNEDRISSDIAGTSKLEVENTLLKAKLASAIAMLCSLHPECEPDYMDHIEDKDPQAEKQFSSWTVAQKTAEALQSKDDHIQQLNNLLNTKHLQCHSYEKRIRELEQRLSDRHSEMNKFSASNSGKDHAEADALANKEHFDESETSAITTSGTVAPEPMDEGFNSLIHKNQHGSISSEQKADLGHDEAMSENICVDFCMTEGKKKEFSEEDAGGKDAAHMDPETDKASDQNLIARPGPALESPECDDKMVQDLEASHSNNKGKDEELLVINEALLEKARQCAASEDRARIALSKAVQLHGELESNAELLRECQMNCAHLENRLHEAREEARTNLCAAERQATEYNTLRMSTVKLHGLMQRLRNCVSLTADGIMGFVDSICALSASLASSAANDSRDDATADFHATIRMLADKVKALSLQRTELFERCKVMEANQGHLAKELESKTEMIKTLYAKRRLEKQICKEKICFTRFEIHELAVFMPNASGFYEALNKNCPNYFLSDESIELFLELRSGQQCIVGQIVHIDRNVAKSPAPADGNELHASGIGSSRARYNPYGLQIGTEYFVVTLAVVPDLIPSSIQG